MRETRDSNEGKLDEVYRRYAVRNMQENRARRMAEMARQHESEET